MSNKYYSGGKLLPIIEADIIDEDCDDAKENERIVYNLSKMSSIPVYDPTCSIREFIVKNEQKKNKRRWFRKPSVRVSGYWKYTPDGTLMFCQSGDEWD